MGHSVVGFEPDRLAVLGDRLIQLTLILQGGAEVVVGHSVIGLEPDGLAVLGDRLIQLTLVVQGVPRL